MSVDDYVSLLNQYQLGGYHQPVLQQTQVGEATEQPVANFEAWPRGASPPTEWCSRACLCGN